MYTVCVFLAGIPLISKLPTAPGNGSVAITTVADMPKEKYTGTNQEDKKESVCVWAGGRGGRVKVLNIRQGLSNAVALCVRGVCVCMCVCVCVCV